MKCQHLLPLLIPLPCCIYILMLPALAQIEYYPTENNAYYGNPYFANNIDLWPGIDAPISISLYIATPQGSGAFATLVTPSLAYMWLNPIIQKYNSIASIISLALFDIFWFLFFITPVTIASENHLVFVSLFITFLTLHDTLNMFFLIWYTSSVKERIIDIFCYMLVLISLIGLSVTAYNNVGFDFYIFECAAFISAFYLTPVLSVLESLYNGQPQIDTFSFQTQAENRRIPQSRAEIVMSRR